jgi:hypothetical protein
MACMGSGGRSGRVRCRGVRCFVVGIGAGWSVGHGEEGIMEIERYE